jgi:outer membrane protein OmpA-like peptidoglycan-associated protein
VFGGRIQANAWQSKGGWNSDVNEQYKWKYVAPGIDLMFNLSNWFAGWNPKRVFNLTAFIGGGANIGFSNDEVNDIAQKLKSNLGAYQLEYVWDGTKVRPYGRAGLEAAFRLSSAVALTVEGNANILSDKYNSKKAGNADWYFNALAGVKVNLGKTYTERVIAAPVPEPVAAPVPAPVVVEQPAPKPEPVVVEPIRRDVFFAINSFAIADTEAQKVKDVADYLQKYPKAKVVVTGYADAGTGNDKINDRLAAQRADAVVTALRTQYGVSPERISYDSRGARVQPFAENDRNRVTICIAE